MKLSKSKKKIFIIICMFLCFSSGIAISRLTFKSKADIEVVSNQEKDKFIKPEQSGTDTIKQEEFDSWVSNIAQMEIENYTFNPELSGLGMSVRTMGKKLSFGKRDVLTTTGILDFQKDISTEKTITFSDGTKLFTIAFMITDQNIGNDFQGSDWQYSNTDNIYCVPLVMTYNNLIILTTLQDSENFVDFAEAINLTENVLEVIQNHSL